MTSVGYISRDLLIIIRRILREELPGVDCEIRESAWVGPYKRVRIAFDIYGRRWPLYVYLTQDGACEWKAASFVDGGVCFEKGTSPDILRKLIAREALISRLQR
jgi:hypothetical protein